MASTAKRHECGVCGRYQTRERLVFSKWTRVYYCSDLKACRKRAMRRADIDPREAVTA